MMARRRVVTEGQIYVNGELCSLAQASQQIGFLPQKTDLPSATRVDELLGLFALLRGIESTLIREHVNVTLRIFNAGSFVCW